MLVSAASSLTDALREVAKDFTVKNPAIHIQFNFGASGVLAKQIEQGAPVDVFASAGEKEMDEVEHDGKVLVHSRENFVSNRLVLIAPIRSRLRDWKDLLNPNVKRIALPIPEQVPSGRYGQETLKRRKIWPLIQAKLVLAHNVRQALAYVIDGDVEAGIVFLTDAQIEKERVKIVAFARPKFDHTPIIYPAAVISGSPNSLDARRFEQYLLSASAQRILKIQGFSPPP